MEVVAVAVQPDTWYGFETCKMQLECACCGLTTMGDTKLSILVYLLG